MTNKQKIQDHINLLENSNDEMVPMSQVREMILAVKELFEGNFNDTTLELYGELGELAKYINGAKKELQSFRPDTLSKEKLPEASDQLAAIVSTTEDATRKIMDSCDEVGSIHERVRDRLLSIEPAIDSDIMMSIEESLVESEDAVTRIYEACTFQDLTGQRIQRIVETLKEVERQVLRMVIVFGVNNEHNTSLDEKAKEELKSDAELLNGPQLPGSSLEQDDIDDILNQLL